MDAASELDRIVVVLGAHSDEVRGAVDFGRAEPVVCEGWNEGISASLRCAVRAVPDAAPLVIALGDQPGLTPEAVGAVVRAALADPGTPAARAVYGGVPGHPVAIRQPLFDAVMDLRGDNGAGRLLVSVVEVECSGLAAGTDVDTAQQLDALRS
jgi:molybdenum cofactor cytidylyltransferase